MRNQGSGAFKGVDKSVDKGVDKFVTKKLSTGYPQVIHRVIHRLSTGLSTGLFALLRASNIDSPLNTINNGAELLVFLQPFFYSTAGVQGSRMIFTTKSHADHRIRRPCEFATQKHSHLAWEGDEISTPLRGQVSDAHPKIFADRSLHGLDGEFPVFFLQQVLQHLAGEVDRNDVAGQYRHRF